jgi:hypothetical protein
MPMMEHEFHKEIAADVWVLKVIHDNNIINYKYFWSLSVEECYTIHIFLNTEAEG